MGLLDQFTQAVDARKRYYGNIVRGLLDNPQALMEQLRAQNAENVREQSRSVQDTRSVMPGIAEPAKQAAFDEAMNVGLLGLTAYHGSPYQFDKFDMSKIGTGEGAQAYGHGLYFAETPEVAKQYQDALKWRGANWDDAHVIAAQAAEKYGNREAASESLKWALSQNSKSPNPMQVKSNEITKQAISILDNGGPLTGKPPSRGHMYKVDIPDEAVAKMLDWDKPLSQQPENVRKALKKSWIAHPDVDAKLTGAQIYQRAGVTLQGKEGTQAAAEQLRAAGIPGIRYLDGGSRGAGSGTSNFVVFDPEIIKILSRE